MSASSKSPVAPISFNSAACTSVISTDSSNSMAASSDNSRTIPIDSTPFGDCVVPINSLISNFSSSPKYLFHRSTK